jgi:hypothetical protein
MRLRVLTLSMAICRTSGHFETAFRLTAVILAVADVLTVAGVLHCKIKDLKIQVE